MLLNNIDRLRKIAGLSDNALSKKAGREDAIRNLRRYASGEIKGMWTLDTLEAVAAALGTTSWEILKPRSPPVLDEETQELMRSFIRDELSAPAPAAKAKRSR